MESIIFIIAWIVTGLLANLMVYKRTKETISYIASRQDVELSENEAEKYADELIDKGIGIKEKNSYYSALIKVIIAGVFSIALWPVITPFSLVKLHRWEKEAAE